MPPQLLKQSLYGIRRKFAKARVSLLAMLVVSMIAMGSGLDVFAEVPPELFTAAPRAYNRDDHIVSTSVFHWYTLTGHQLRSPWVALGGRDTWTGEPEFWKGQIKQIMSANIDMMYVHLMGQQPLNYEQQRINLFQALNELRASGYDVPKVARFWIR